MDISAVELSGYQVIGLYCIAAKALRTIKDDAARGLVLGMFFQLLGRSYLAPFKATF